MNTIPISLYYEVNVTSKGAYINHSEVCGHETDLADKEMEHRRAFLENSYGYRVIGECSVAPDMRQLTMKHPEFDDIRRLCVFTVNIPIDLATYECDCEKDANVSAADGGLSELRPYIAAQTKAIENMANAINQMMGLERRLGGAMMSCFNGGEDDEDDEDYAF